MRAQHQRYLFLSPTYTESIMNRMEALCGLGCKAIAVTALSLWSAAGAAQLLGTTPSGQAAAVRSTALGLTTSLVDTGTLGGAADARNASQLSGALPGLLAAEVLQATTIGWPDQAASDASLANLGMMVAGIGISADFVMASATALAGAAGSGASLVDNLAINGSPVQVSGAANQVVDFVGGRIVINEQQASAGGIVVNALHVIVYGVADVVVGSASAAIR
jgi:hypothetical protein